MHTLGSSDIFAGVGIWVFNVKTRIYCRGVKTFKQNTEKCLSVRRGWRYSRENSGVLASCRRVDEVFDVEYVDHKSMGKRFTKKIPSKK